MSERAFIWTVMLSSFGALVLAGLLLAGGLARAESGIASVYGGSDGLCGHKMANGRPLDCSALTAASKTLRLGSHARVCKSGGRCVTVRITDRGPFVRGRIIDLSPASARALGVDGLAHVTVEALP